MFSETQLAQSAPAAGTIQRHARAASNDLFSDNVGVGNQSSAGSKPRPFRRARLAAFSGNTRLASLCNLDALGQGAGVRRATLVGALGTAQTLAWASSYYPPVILADPIAQDLGLSGTTVFGLFSGAVLLSAVLGPSVGRAIDNRGGRGVLALSNPKSRGGWRPDP
jgi:hypothetical protein